MLGLHDHTAARKGAVLGEADDRVALLAVRAEAHAVAGRLEGAGACRHLARQHRGHFIFEGVTALGGPGRLRAARLDTFDGGADLGLEGLLRLVEFVHALALLFQLGLQKLLECSLDGGEGRVRKLGVDGSPQRCVRLLALLDHA